MVLPLSLAWWSRQGEKEFRSRIVSSGFALLLLAQIIAQFLYSERGTAPRWQEMMPLHLCDLALFSCVFACISRKQVFFEIAYFWGLAGTIHGLFTPDLDTGFPAVQFWLFFIGHGGIVGCILYLVAGLRFRPIAKSVSRAYLMLLAYGVISGVFNAFFGTNYGYTRAKPGSGSLMDFLGDWPWYIVSLAVLAVVSFLILYLPWWIKDRLGQEVPETR